jgi:hypothetical protein
MLFGCLLDDNSWIVHPPPDTSLKYTRAPFHLTSTHPLSFLPTCTFLPSLSQLYPCIADKKKKLWGPPQLALDVALHGFGYPCLSTVRIIGIEIDTQSSETESTDFFQATMPVIG